MGGTLTLAGSQVEQLRRQPPTSPAARCCLEKTAGIAIPHDLVLLLGATTQLGASNQISPTAHVTINSVNVPSTLDLNGFNNTIGRPELCFQRKAPAPKRGRRHAGRAMSITPDLSRNRDHHRQARSSAGAARTVTFLTAATTGVMKIDATVTGGPGTAGPVLTKAGPGTLLLTAPNTFGGAGETINVTGGILQATTDSSLGDPQNSLVLGNAATGAEFQAGSTFASSRTISLGTGGGGVDVPTNLGLTLNGQITGTTGLMKTGNGILVLTGNNSFSGGITITGGILNPATAGALGASDSSNPIILAGGELLPGASGLTLNNQLTFSALAQTTFDAPTTRASLVLSSTSVLGGSGALRQKPTPAPSPSIPPRTGPPGAWKFRRYRRRRQRQQPDQHRQRQPRSLARRQRRGRRSISTASLSRSPESPSIPWACSPTTAAPPLPPAPGLSQQPAAR